MCVPSTFDMLSLTFTSVDLIDAGDRHAHGEPVEDHVLDAFELRRLNDDAGGSGTGDESLRLRALTPRTAVRIPDVVGVVA